MRYGSRRHCRAERAPSGRVYAGARDGPLADRLQRRVQSFRCSQVRPVQRSTPHKKTRRTQRCTQWNVPAWPGGISDARAWVMGPASRHGPLCAVRDFDAGVRELSNCGCPSSLPPNCGRPSFLLRFKAGWQRYGRPPHCWQGEWPQLARQRPFGHNQCSPGCSLRPQSRRQLSSSLLPRLRFECAEVAR